MLDGHHIRRELGDQGGELGAQRSQALRQRLPDRGADDPDRDCGRCGGALPVDNGVSAARQPRVDAEHTRHRLHEHKFEA